jgi:sugar phosphate isomerase/epimerase
MPDLPLGAVIAFDFKAWNVADEIALLQAAGVRRVHVYRNYTHGITAEFVRDTLAAAHLAADGLHGYFQLEKFEVGGPPFDPSSDSEEARAASVEILRGEADFARTLGCTDIAVHPVSKEGSTADPWRPAAFARTARDLAEIGRAKGVRYLLENMPPRQFGCDVSYLRRLVDAVASPHLGLLYDSGHAALCGDPVGAIRTMGPRLWGVHLHDNRGTEDDHLIPGMGTLPFEAIARTLAEVGYAGTFMIEVYRPTEEVRRDLTPARLAHIEKLRRIASGL